MNVDTRTNILSICSGYGGIELGLDTALVGEGRTVCYVENEIGVASILAARMEDGTLDPAPVWSDLRTFDAKPWRGKVDLLSGGFPCQPHSVAGRKKGRDDSRELSGEVYRIAEELGYPTLFLENVPGIMRFYYDNIRPSLQEMGYTVKEGLFTANETGAPHRRQRLFILAYTPSSGIGDIARKARRKLGIEDVRQGDRQTCTVRTQTTGGELAHAEHQRSVQSESQGQPRCREELSQGSSNELAHAEGIGSELADPIRDGSGEPEAETGDRSGNMAHANKYGESRTKRTSRVGEYSQELADSSGEGLEGLRPTWEEECQERPRDVPLYPPGPTDHERWSYLLDIMPEAQPAFCNVLDGTPKGVARRLQAAGNGVVPLCAAYAFHYLARNAGSRK
jgi:DNA (cytosine-5)-methyltransferase 1